ncbi:MAG: DNA-3-methyladenine glycosylase [Acidobacteria bacterium]|jgi:DNA-3-methyladenine glycosylase|nr:DNA-3-methyladenine glycosylase [Acidobacteriota bacterium]
MTPRSLPAAFYRRPAGEVARDLLGRTLCRRLPDGSVRAGRIVEVEAYDGPDDRASHARAGRTRRTAPMYEAGGIAYVYLVYGMHHCLNLVTGAAGYPAAILVRAAESPLPGSSASGPGRLTRAFAIDRALDGAPLTGPEVWLEAGEPVPDRAVARTARIGVDYAGGWARRKLRWLIREHPAVSGPRRGR